MRSQAEHTVILGSSGGNGSKLPARTPMPARLGRYELTHELGKGAMGVVYQGRDPRINREIVETGDMGPANGLYDAAGFTEAYRGHFWERSRPA